MITDEQFDAILDTVSVYVTEFMDSSGEDYRRDLREELNSLVKKWVDRAFEEAKGMYTTEEYLPGISKEEFYKKYDL